MIETPRTDAAVMRQERTDGDIDEVVPADCARNIERDLKKAHLYIQTMQKIVERYEAAQMGLPPMVYDPKRCG